jgi:hypothetical protein
MRPGRLQHDRTAEGICDIEAGNGTLIFKMVPYRIDVSTEWINDGFGGEVPGLRHLEAWVNLDAEVRMRLFVHDPELTVILENGHRWRCSLTGDGRLLNRDNPPPV